MLTLQSISYSHPNRDVVFSNLSFSISDNSKTALIGNNGVGKSTLLKIIAGELMPSSGQVLQGGSVYYVPQIFGQYNHLSVAQALNIENKLSALKSILSGVATAENFDALQDDWSIEERVNAAFNYWQLSGISLEQKMDTLSGGQKTKVFLAGISVYEPEFVLLDEPSNHLDIAGRQILYSFIANTKGTLLVVSHDKKLLNLLNNVCEMTSSGIALYGGNYEFYAEQKQIENTALASDVEEKEKALRKAKEKQRETMERQQKLDSRGKRKQEKAGVATIMMNTLRNKAENSTAKLKDVHAEKMDAIAIDLKTLRALVPDMDKMKLTFNNAILHNGKVLIDAKDVNFQYGLKPVWKSNLNFQIASGERIAIRGANGSGKTTLVKMLLGKLEPQSGRLYRGFSRYVYIDQDYTLLDKSLNVYEQAQQFNDASLQEHEIKIRLSRFLFKQADWDKLSYSLSGGERMRLLLCCLTIVHQAPEIIVLDEPTNNLDIQNTDILTNAVKDYQGTLLVISHDEYFLEQVGINRELMA